MDVQKVNSNQPQTQFEESQELRPPEVVPQFSIRFDRANLNYQVIEQLGEDQITVHYNCYSDCERAKEICSILQYFSESGVARIVNDIERQLRQQKYLDGLEGVPLCRDSVDTLIDGVRAVLLKFSGSQERYNFFDSYVDNPVTACRELVERYELPERAFIGLPAGGHELYPVPLMNAIEFIASIDENNRVWADPYYAELQGAPGPEFF